MFVPLPAIQNDDNIGTSVANRAAAAATSPEIEGKTAAVSVETVKKAVVPQIDEIQKVLRFAQIVKSKQEEH
jgi:hypothetical protein